MSCVGQRVRDVLVGELRSICCVHSILQQTNLTLHVPSLHHVVLRVLLIHLLKLGDLIHRLTQFFLQLLTLSLNVLALEVRGFSSARTGFSPQAIGILNLIRLHHARVRACHRACQ